jgi:archaemetzincin
LKRADIAFVMLALVSGLSLNSCSRDFLNSDKAGSDKTQICILPIGDIDKGLLEYLKSNLADIFPGEVRILGSQRLPSGAYNSRRRQYHSTTILEKLGRLKPDDCQRLLGIIDVDLYVPDLNFVFGEADPGQGNCIISLTRLRQSYYGYPEDEALFKKRALKEAVHELGHTWGLGHCRDSRCVMYFSNSLLDTDNKGFEFCSRCRARVFGSEVK